MNKKALTPCIGVCSTRMGDEVCRGCKRYMHEIADWITYSEAEKHAVMKRLSQLLSGVLGEKIRVTSPELLRSQLQARQIDVIHPEGDAECVQALLRSAAGQLFDPGAFGIEILPGYCDMSPLKLRDLVEAEYHQLALAHRQGNVQL